MAKTRTTVKPTEPDPLEQSQAGDLAETLESLLKASQESASELARLLDRTEQVQTVMSQAGAALEDRLRRGTDLLGTAGPGDHLGTRTEQLEAARAVAEAADQAKSCFLAAMSRELRTPVDGLARVIGLLQQTQLDEEQRRYVQTANRSVCALLSLVDSILDASTLDAGMAELRSTDFDVRRIVNDATELTMSVARAKGLAIGRGIDPDVPAILRGEPGRLQQILVYAIRRAIQLASHGEVTVGASVEHAGDSVTTVRFTIDHADTELSEDELILAFAPSAHLEAATSRPEGGLGLGLTIARRIVEFMGGRMDTERNRECGFTIWFTLPLDNYRQDSSDRRVHGRLPQELLQSNLGPVLDLSMGGMRVQCSKAPKGRVAVELLDLDDPVTISAEVMWAHRQGFRKYEVGLYFPHIAPGVAKQLTRISLNHRLRRLLGMT